MTTITTPAERAPGRILRAKEPTLTYRELDRRTRRFITGTVVTMFACVLLAAFLLPLAFMLTSALKTEDQIANGQILPVSPATTAVDGEEVVLLNVPFDDGVRALALVSPGRQESIFVDPDDPTTEIVWAGNWRGLEPNYSLDLTWSNFGDAWEQTDPDMSRLLLNTGIISGLGMAGTIISSTLVAYGLSRFRIPFKGLILGSLLATIILPRFVTLIPTYVMFNQFGWIGTILPLTVPHFFSNAYNVFLLRQFFLTIPKDLDEAAAIDGAGPMRTLLTVILPQAKGAVLAIALFHFFFAWNDFLEPLVFLGGATEWSPVSLGLAKFLGIYDTNIPLVLSGAFIAMIIPLLVFVLLQRIFLRGIDLSGSVK